MAWFFGKKKTPDLAALEEELLQNKVRLSTGLKRKLKLLDFEQSWVLVGNLLPQVDKAQMRSIVRFLFTDELWELEAKLVVRKDLEQAIFCLHYLPHKEVVSLLVDLLAHLEKRIQLLAAGALQNHTPRLVVPEIIERLLKSEIPAARAGEVLLTMGYLGQDALLEAYGWAEPQVKAQILELLTLGQNPKCEPFLAEALQSEEPLLRKAALEAVSVFLFRDLWPQVAACLVDCSWPLQVKSIKLLTKLGIREAGEMVRPFLQNEDPWVRKVAATYFEVLALGR